MIPVIFWLLILIKLNGRRMHPRSCEPVMSWVYLLRWKYPAHVRERMSGYFLLHEFRPAKLAVWGLLLLAIRAAGPDSCNWVLMTDYFLIRILCQKEDLVILSRYLCKKDRVHRGEAFLLILISSLILINGLFLHRWSRWMCRILNRRYYGLQEVSILWMWTLSTKKTWATTCQGRQ